MPSLFFSYSHADEALRDQLEVQLAMLKRQGVIEAWHDRRITAGENLNQAISERIESDDIILLLVSPDFLASNYCYDIEMARAMERHRAGEAVVIPVILRPSDWLHPPLNELRATPRDGLAVTKWPDRDEAFLEVVKDIRAAAERLGKRTNATAPAPAAKPQASPAPTAFAPGPRSSNLRLAKTFTDHDKDRFKLDAFEYIAGFFENSLRELGQRNEGIDGTFRRIDGDRFTASIYRDGKALARCTVFLGSGGFGASGICYLNGETTRGDSMNEQLSVEADDQSMFLRSLGMAMMRGHDREQKLSEEGAAELYWSLLIQPLQGRG